MNKKANLAIGNKGSKVVSSFQVRKRSSNSPVNGSIEKKSRSAIALKKSFQHHLKCL